MRDTVFGALSQESTMKSRCCTFYKNTSESTSLCKLDTDSSPSPPVPCRSCLPRQPSNPEHKWLSAQVGVSRPERGRRVESTFPLDSATFFHFPSWRSAPAQLLILFLSSSLAVNAFFFFFFAATPSILGINGQWSVSQG